MSITWTKLGTRSVQGVTSALTESAPSGDAGAGVDLNGVDSVRVTVVAPSGQTFSGGGSILLYRRSPYLRTFDPVEGGDLDMSGADGATITFLPIPVLHKSGQLVAIPSGVTVSGGTSLTILLEASYGAGGPNQ